MEEPLHIISWGTASVLARRGKKPETNAVAYRVPILIEAVASAEAPIAAREPGTDDLGPSVIRHLQARLISPILLSGEPVDREMLPAIALLTASLFHIPKPEAPAGKLDDVRWRQILEDGEAEAVRLAAAKAAEFVLVDDILHRRVEPPVWTVAPSRVRAGLRFARRSVCVRLAAPTLRRRTLIRVPRRPPMTMATIASRVDTGDRAGAGTLGRCPKDKQRFFSIDGTLEQAGAISSGTFPRLIQSPRLKQRVS